MTLACTHCNKRLSRKTARMIDGKVMCSACMFAPAIGDTRRMAETGRKQMTEWRRLESPYRNYEISSAGQLRRGGRFIGGTVDRYGYRRVALYYAGCRKHTKIHQLVCGVFHGPPPSPRHEVCHIDGDKLNNAAGNLRWGTRSENAADSIRHGTLIVPAARHPGETHGNAKLTDKLVGYIREQVAAGRQQKEIAEELGITRGQISRIATGKSWSHVAGTAIAQLPTQPPEYPKGSKP